MIQDLKEVLKILLLIEWVSGGSSLDMLVATTSNQFLLLFLKLDTS